MLELLSRGIWSLEPITMPLLRHVIRRGAASENPDNLWRILDERFNPGTPPTLAQTGAWVSAP